MTATLPSYLDQLMASADVACFGIWSVIMILVGFKMGRKTVGDESGFGSSSSKVDMGSVDIDTHGEDPWVEAQTRKRARITSDLDP